MNRREIENRWQRARQGLQQRQMDALLVGEKLNYWYLTGHLSREFDKKMRPMLLLLPQAGSASLILYGQAEKAARASCPAQRVYPYQDVPFPCDLLARAIRESGLQRGRIGMEFGENERLGLSFVHFQVLQDLLPDVEFVDAGDLLQELRGQKSQFEVERIQRSCAVSLVAWEQTQPQLRIGMTDPEIQQILAAELCRAGSDCNVEGHVTAGNGTAGKRGYREGDILWCDFGATLEGYQADLARRAVFGNPSPDQIRAHQQIYDILQAQIEAIRPGVKASQVAAVVSEQLVAHGYPPLGAKKRVGHGLGLGPAEAPSLSLADDTVLKPGMILTPEPRFTLESGERVHIEEVVVVTESGCRQLSRGAERLSVIPLEGGTA